jgi:hypothetical protein
MTKKSKLLTQTLLSAVAISMVGSIVLASSAKAEQLWDPYLRGVNEGVPAGALPPPGVYGVLDNYWANYSAYNNSGHKVSGTSLTALVEVPIVLWVPGFDILGASYAAGIAQPFDYTNSTGLTHHVGSASGNWGTFNTILIPGILSWSLPNNFFASAGIEVYLPDASSTVDSFPHNGGLPSGNAFAAIQPDLGLSWLSDGWDLSVGTHVSIPVTSDHAYRSAAEFSADYTATKTIGNWTFGVGASQENQFGDDSSYGHSVANTAVTNFSIGPIVGYQFGGIGIQATWNQTLVTHNDVGGNFVNIRLVTAF